MTAEFDATTQLHLKTELDSLYAEFDGVHPRDRVDRVMADSIERLRKPDGVATYLPALARRLARERLRAAGQREGTIAKDTPEVLFVSGHDMGRAQIAAAVMSKLGGDRVSVHSAASAHDLGELDPGVKLAIEELGVDLDVAYAKPLTDEVLEGADVIVTMGRSVGEVVIPDGVDYRDWRVGDPRGAPIDEVRRIRADVAERVEELLAELAPEESPTDPATRGAS